MRVKRPQIEPAIGVKIGYATVIDFCRIENKLSKSSKGVICKCDCGKTFITSYSSLKNQSTRSCGCLYSPDLTGNKYGRMTVICRDNHNYKNFYCKCECGVVKSVSYSHLKRGRIVSCGCKKASANYMSKDKIYRAWSGMRERCYNPNNISYPNYGGKGIKVCDRGLQSFNNFFEDVGLPPTKHHSLDRIRVKEDYKPDNVRWATDAQQAANRNNNFYLTYNDETLCAYQMAKKYGVVEGNVFLKRIKIGWSIEEALFTPKLKNKYERKEKTSQTCSVA